MKKSISLVFGTVLFLFSLLYAQINLESPIAGTWANKQMLVIESASDGDYFYSVDGSDPASFGFAYDGPVLLDVDGEITLKVAKIISKNKSESTEVKYKVVQDQAETKAYSDFISSFFDTGVINYTSGTELVIPSELQYSFGLPPDSFVPGQKISLAENTALTRSIPCTLWDTKSDKKWRFYVRTFPVNAGIFSRQNLPIRITDWDTVEFLDQDLIYRIDSEYWGLPKKPVKLDRSVSHMISWQSIAYEQGNPVEFIVLPPKATLQTREGENGELIIGLEGDSSYKLSVIKTDSLYEELFDELGVDVFYGDKVSGELKVGIYASGLLQAVEKVSYSLNRRQPTCPLISSDANGFYTRKNVTVTIEGDGKGDLYYAVSEPLSVNKNTNPENVDFKNWPVQKYVKAESGSITLTFTGLKESGVYYKIRAYTLNKKTPSDVAEYDFLIDQYNYYIAETSAADIKDGTYEHPYTDFAELLENINQNETVCVTISGNVSVPKGKNELKANCSFKGDSESALVFEPDAQFVLKSSIFNFDGINIKNKKSSAALKIVPLFKAEKAVVSFKDCLIYGDFEKNGTLIDSTSSMIYIDNSMVAASAVSYACVLTAVDTTLSITDSSFTTSSDTAVILSLSDCNFTIMNNNFKVTGKSGRIAEIIKSTGVMAKNVFKGDLTKVTSAVLAVYSDKKSSVTLEENENYGF